MYPLIKSNSAFGRVAQLVEHYLDMVVVVGSSPIVATIKLTFLALLSIFLLLHLINAMNKTILIRMCADKAHSCLISCIAKESNAF